jgi:hypothetical protein
MKFKKSKNRKTKEERCVWAPKKKTRERKKQAARTGLDKKKENKNLGKRKERRTPAGGCKKILYNTTINQGNVFTILTVFQG